jgi:molybdopterin/thiamine biosynthesis adenylyltransferase
MSELYLNPFIFIGKQKDQYFINTGLNLPILLTGQQAEFLMTPGSFQEQKLSESFTADELERLMNAGCLIPLQFNMLDRNSRTRGYFHELGMLQQYDNLCKKHVFLLGAGALGTHLGWGLCALGITKFTILDYDIIEESNLNRQILYTSKDIGELKTEVLKKHLLEINPKCEIITLNRKIISGGDLYDVIPPDCDLVIRGIDTPMQISEWVFSACEWLKKPYISGGTVGTNALLGPCYVPDVTPGYDTVTMNGVSMYGNTSYAIRVCGTGVSSGFAISYVASELMLEAVKILTDQGYNLKYGGRIEIKNLFQNTQSATDSEDSDVNTSQKDRPIKQTLELLLYLLFAFLTMTVVTIFFPCNTFLLLYAYLMVSTIGYFLWKHSLQQPPFAS